MIRRLVWYALGTYVGSVLRGMWGRWTHRV